MIKLFKYEDSDVRIKTDENEMFWVAGVDVCDILGYSNSTQAIEKLDDDEKKLDYLTDSSGQRRKSWTINEFGLYSLVLTSSKTEAKMFKRWITHEVLLAIRKAGKYTSDEEKEREESIQELVSHLENLTEKRDHHRKLANDTTKEIESKNKDLMVLLKTDFRQKKIQFVD